jgi:hypothetical protein
MRKWVRVISVFAVLLMVSAFILLLPPDGTVQAQNTPPPTPDCQFTLAITASGRTSAVSNQPGSTFTGKPCSSWRVYYTAYNMSAISLEFDGTNDVNGVAGSSWTAFTSVACPSTNPCTIVSGTNPMTDANQSTLSVTGYFPWVSLNAGTYTSSGSPNFIRVVVYGYKSYVQ